MTQLSTRSLPSEAGDQFGSLTPRRVLRPHEQVEQQIEEAITSGAIKHGDRLPSEVQMAEKFGVSRPTVREALARLSQKGLLIRAAGARGGAFVQYIDSQAVGEAFSERLATTLELGSLSYDEVAEFREMLEIPSARLAALNASEADIAFLREMIDAEKAIVVSDPVGREINRDFHVGIAGASGNRLLKALVAELHRFARPALFIDWTPEIGRLGVQHHIDIVRAIRHHDPDGAQDAMHAHLDFLREHTR